MEWFVMLESLLTVFMMCSWIFGSPHDANFEAHSAAFGVIDRVR